MTIEISNNAKHYLENKHANEITVDLVLGGNEIIVGEPNVSVGKPTHIHEKYEMYEVDGYTVYIYEQANVPSDTITIDSKKHFGRETLKVKGLKLM